MQVGEEPRNSKGLPHSSAAGADPKQPKRIDRAWLCFKCAHLAADATVNMSVMSPRTRANDGNKLNRGDLPHCVPMLKTEARIGCERDNQQPAVPLVLVVPSVSQKAADSQSPIITILFRIAPLGLKHE